MTTVQSQKIIQDYITQISRLPLERMLTTGITGSGKSYQWLKLARRLKPIGSKFRVVDTDNDIDYMLRTQFPDLLPENGGNVYVSPAYDWPEYEKSVHWIMQAKLTDVQLASMDKYLQLAYKTPIRPIDWVVVDKSNNAWSSVQNHFVSEVFGEDTGEYFLEVRKRLWAAGDIGKSGKKAVSTVLEGLDGWKDWCLTPDTQILTKHGWATYNSLTLGEDVFTLDTSTRMTKWRPLNDIYVSTPGQRRMIMLEKRSHSSLSTLEHRWPVFSYDNSLEWRLSKELKSTDRIIKSAPHERYPMIRTYSDDLVKVVAWYVTEGSRTDRRYPQGTISQSEKKEDNTASIRASLKAEFGDIHERRRDWGVIMFDLPYHVMQRLDDIAPNKCPSHEFLLKLTYEQLDSFIHTCLLGDGSITGEHQGTFCQKRSDITEAFEFACALRGLPTKTIMSHNESRFGDPDIHLVDVLKRTLATVPYETMKEVDYDGVVWCPVTDTGTWLAKRNGTVFFTGNSVINKLYDDWINPIVYRVRCHVYATADVDNLDTRTEKDPEVLNLFGAWKIKPSGQKKIGGQMHTILLLIPGSDSTSWFISTMKDRAGRKYFNKSPLNDLYTQYLFMKAGWPLIDMEEA